LTITDEFKTVRVVSPILCSDLYSWKGRGGGGAASEGKFIVVATMTCRGLRNCSGQRDDWFMGYLTLGQITSLQAHGTGSPLG